MYETAATSKVVRVRRYATRKASVALLVALVAVGLVGPVLVAGLVAPPAHAATATTPHIVVNSELDGDDTDLGDGVCDATASLDTTCTLRAAIEQANTHAGPDTIDFSVSELIRDPITGVATISVSTPLPAITDPVVVNGYSQPGSQANTLAKGTNAKPLIEITPAAGFSRSLDTGGITVRSQDVTIKGLVINRFPFTPGIEVSQVFLNLPVNSVKIQGNFLGTDPSGTVDEGNGGPGINLIGSSGSTVGGSTLASRNLISGNGAEGIFIRGMSSFDRGPANNNLVQGNLIGTQKDGTKPLGNDADGVQIFDSAASISGGSHDANGNRIISNSIFSNGRLGINLVESFDGVGPNANDAGDPDAGPNHLQNKPVLSSARNADGKTTVRGALHTRPIADLSYTIQFFSNPSGQNEGQNLLGQKVVKTDGSGDASFRFTPTIKVAAGRTITATATRNSNGDTSEFSAARTVTTL